MTNHTPGPWVQEAWEPYTGTNEYYSPDRIIRDATSRQCVARIPSKLVKEHEANARLIAAAPDTFVALLPLLERARVLLGDRAAEWPSLAAEIAAADAAIAKATGAA